MCGRPSACAPPYAVLPSVDKPRLAVRTVVSVTWWGVLDEKRTSDVVRQVRDEGGDDRDGWVGVRALSHRPTNGGDGGGGAGSAGSTGVACSQIVFGVRICVCMERCPVRACEQQPVAYVRAARPIGLVRLNPPFSSFAPITQSMPPLTPPPLPPSPPPQGFSLCACARARWPTRPSGGRTYCLVRIRGRTNVQRYTLLLYVLYSARAKGIQSACKCKLVAYSRL